MRTAGPGQDTQKEQAGDTISVLVPTGAKRCQRPPQAEGERIRL